MRLIIGSLALLMAGAGPADVALPGPRACPESVTSAADGTLYISNIAEGGVLRKRPGGAAEPWIKPNAFGSGTTYGVTVDARAKLLWVCSNDLSSSGLAKSDDGSSAVKGFDLATGAGKVSLPFGPAPAECNDIAVGADGSLYVTDTAQPRLFRAAPGARTLEIWATDPRFDDKGGGLDGIAIGADGAIYVNTLGSGRLFRIAIGAGGKAGPVTQLVPDRPLGSTDGMRHVGGNRFIVVTGNGHLERLTVTDGKVAVETLAEGLDEPTGVTVVGGTALIAEGRLSYLFDKAKRGQQPALPFRLRAVPLAQ
jgi:sugar lactone lactonase YvrE